MPTAKIPDVSQLSLLGGPLLRTNSNYHLMQLGVEGAWGCPRRARSREGTGYTALLFLLGGELTTPPELIFSCFSGSQELHSPILAVVDLAKPSLPLSNRLGGCF